MIKVNKPKINARRCIILKALASKGTRVGDVIVAGQKIKNFPVLTSKKEKGIIILVKVSIVKNRLRWPSSA